MQTRILQASSSQPSGAAVETPKEAGSQKPTVSCFPRSRFVDSFPARHVRCILQPAFRWALSARSVSTAPSSRGLLQKSKHAPEPMCRYHPDTKKKYCVEDGCHGSGKCPHEKYWSVACDFCGRVARKRTTGIFGACKHGKQFRAGCKQCGRVPPKRTTGAHASCAHGKQMRASCKQCGRKSARTNVRASCEHGKQLRNSCKQCGRKSTHNSARSAAVRA